MCDEPTQGIIYRDNRWHSIRLKRNTEDVLEIVKDGNVVGTYQVLYIYPFALPETNMKTTMVVKLFRLG
jgi:hypothetical protein